MKIHSYKKLFPAAKSNANVINWDKLLEGVTGSSLGFHQGKLLQTQKRLKVVCWSVYTAQHVITINADFKKLRSVAQFSDASRKMDIYLNSRISKMHLQSIVISCPSQA